MHTETFEQVSIAEEMIDNPGLLKEGNMVEINFHADTETPLTLEMPPFVELEVTYAEPAEKGNTASSTALKNATLETGAEIMVPLFINTGDIIKVDTRDNSYSERVKK
jgi:elongation factor P